MLIAEMVEEIQRRLGEPPVDVEVARRTMNQQTKRYNRGRVMALTPHGEQVVIEDTVKLIKLELAGPGGSHGRRS